MERSRISIMGPLRVQPVRMDALGRPTSPGVQPTRSDTKCQTPGIGSNKRLRRVSPVRGLDVSLFVSATKSAKKSAKKTPNPPKSRRCLWVDGSKKEEPIPKKSPAHFTATRRSLLRPKVYKATQKFKVPNPTSAKKQSAPAPNKSKDTNTKANQLNTSRTSRVVASTSARKTMVAPSTNVRRTLVAPRANEVSNHDRRKTLSVPHLEVKPPSPDNMLLQFQNVLDQMKATVEEHKNVLLEAKDQFSKAIQEQNSLLQEIKVTFEEQQKFLIDCRSSMEHEFTVLEQRFNINPKPLDSNNLLVPSQQEKTTPCEKENSSKSSSKAAAAYKEMRKSFRCLQTPTFSARKTKTPRSRTPRSILSSKVQSQLKNLFD